ncbi:hypothetical protein Prudu_019627 [Prunus dulcis]|uniref:Uncharacterized protein n=1 Tax=Prunus dulcis TaxID=3755 RepID=A0A4Y1RUT4_PRUDU|nr:hypothetical protein Prudu_019627 [Prunus dulcis]
MEPRPGLLESTLSNWSGRVQKGLSWFDRDQQALNWMRATLSGILQQMVMDGADSSRKVWQNLEQHFAHLSHASIYQLKSELHKVKKDPTIPMADYLEIIKQLTTDLAAAGAPLEFPDLVHEEMRLDPQRTLKLGHASSASPPQEKEEYAIGIDLGTTFLLKLVLSDRTWHPFADTKRLIGRRFSDASVQSDVKLWPFKVIEGPGDKPVIVVTHNGQEKQCSAEDISSMVLVKMRKIAETYLGSTVKNAVITVLLTSMTRSAELQKMRACLLA